ncbi:hypothetical protein [Cellulosimicrobium sp. Marseille-Q4280]|uniref:hypothetical protein n=1 Tax=Cellulosimicrobium sp. Marseille-Q4280 TaxID=2937992 RepID=UPI00203CB37D|nr:hypothetical protein [Cellulosimicrobium sp. Marseille-Q4280]
MNTRTPSGAALRALVPDIMAEHADIVWRFDDHVDGLRVVLSPTAAPERVASLLVHRGEEVFVVELGTYLGVTFEYDEDEKPNELRDRLATAVSALRGPSRLVLTYAGDKQTSSQLVLAPDSPDEHSDGIWVHRLTTELAWRLRLRRLRQGVLEFPPI